MGQIRNRANWSVDTADFNADGYPDLVIGGDDQIGLYEGQGDGTFVNAYLINNTALARAIVIADLDGNSRPDIVAANADAGGVSVYLNHWNGVGNWYGSIQFVDKYSTGVVGPVLEPQPDMIRVGDLNADAYPDIAVANTASNKVSVLFGQGNGTFPTKIDLATSGNPKALAIADVNADGKMDLAVANSDWVSVIFGQGGGTFGSLVPYLSVHNCSSLAAADLDGDGRPELIANSSYWTYGSRVHVLRNQGNGSFKNLIFYATSGAGRIVPADFNYDKRMDLAIAGSDFGSVEVLIGNGTCKFQPAVHYPSSGRVHGLAVADVDGDDDSDLITGNSAGFATLENSGNGTFGPAIDSPPSIPLAGTILRSGDVDGNGIADLVSVGASGIQAALGQGNGNFGLPVLSSGGVAGSDGVFQDAALGDLNGDGKVDVIYRRLDNMIVQLSLGNGSFGPEAQYALPPHPDRLILADFDGDGKLDALTSGFTTYSCVPPSTCIYVYVHAGLWRGNGNGTFGSYSQQNISWNQGYFLLGASLPVGAGDFDGNGTTDIVVSFGGSEWFANPGNGVFGTPTNAAIFTVANANFAPDLNGDGKAEYVYWEGDKVVAYFLGGPGTVSHWFAPSPNDLLTADFDNDGRKDIVTIGKSAPIVSVAFQGTNGSFGPRRDYPVGRTPTSATAGDWDNDGRIDLAVQNQATGTVSILRNHCLP